MKYKKCPRCGLNFILCEENLCKVCLDEIDGRKSIFDEIDDDLICPYCNKNKIGIDDVMCEQCALRRKKKKDDL